MLTTKSRSLEKAEMYTWQKLNNTLETRYVLDYFYQFDTWRRVVRKKVRKHRPERMYDRIDTSLAIAKNIHENVRTFKSEGELRKFINGAIAMPSNDFVELQLKYGADT